MIAILLFLLGLVYTNFLEWLLHKYFLHGLGKNKGSRWSFHFQHHRKCILNKNYDDDYELVGVHNLNELRSLIFVSVLHLPLIIFVPWFYLGAAVGGIAYFIAHRKCHLNTKWGKKYMPWHYVHHMQESSKNWCVTYPLFDILLGTYVPYENENTRQSTQDSGKQKNRQPGSSSDRQNL